MEAKTCATFQRTKSGKTKSGTKKKRSGRIMPKKKKGKKKGKKEK